MPPLLLLALLLALTVLAWMVHKALRFRHMRILRQLAGQWQMRFVEDDLFNLGRRVAAVFPVPGAANLCVRDVIYGSEGATHRYVFTVVYTTGALGRHRREARAATFHDPAEHAAADAPADLRLAEEDLSLLDQYESLRQSHWGQDRPAALAPAQ